MSDPMNLSYLSDIPQLRGGRIRIPIPSFPLDHISHYQKHTRDVWQMQGSLKVVGVGRAFPRMSQTWTSRHSRCMKEQARPMNKALRKFRRGRILSTASCFSLPSILLFYRPLCPWAPGRWPSLWSSASPNLFLPQGLCLETSSHEIFMAIYS